VNNLASQNHSLRRRADVMHEAWRNFRRQIGYLGLVLEALPVRIRDIHGAWSTFMRNVDYFVDVMEDGDDDDE